MFSLFLDFFHWLPTYFFPKLCFECGAAGAYVCPKCKPKVKCLLSEPISLICPICQRLSFGGWVHPQCRKRYGLDRLISFYEYAGWAKKIIKNVKFKKNKIYRALTDLSTEFALALKGDSLPVYPPECVSFWRGKVSPYKVSASLNNFVLIPVPLHWYRRLKRGLNQSSLIAQALGRGLNIPVNEKILKRVRHTEPQTLVDRQSRLKNISGAFACSLSNVAMKQFNNVAILLVDDVYTTGTTLTECCRVLKKAGAKHVWALTLLRA